MLVKSGSLTNEPASPMTHAHGAATIGKEKKRHDHLSRREGQTDCAGSCKHKCTPLYVPNRSSRNYDLPGNNNKSKQHEQHQTVPQSDKSRGINKKEKKGKLVDQKSVRQWFGKVCVVEGRCRKA